MAGLERSKRGRRLGPPVAFLSPPEGQLVELVYVGPVERLGARVRKIDWDVGGLVARPVAPSVAVQPDKVADALALDQRQSGAHTFSASRARLRAARLLRLQSTRDSKDVPEFANVHAPIHNHVEQDRHLNRRAILKQNRTAAVSEWHQLSA